MLKNGKWPKIMKIVIENKKKIFTIQKEFSSVFPFLKIEFFSRPHKVNESSQKRFMCRSDKTIEACSFKPKAEGKISITPDTTVSELEYELKKAYGLSVQVFRKSGNIWLETTVTDQWSLKKQNEVGKSLSEAAELKYSNTSYEDMELR
jgi:hypothetical protein